MRTSSKSLNRTLLIAVTALLIPIVPFLIIGELPGERWLSAADDNAAWFALTGGALLGADILLPVPSSIVITLLGGRLGFFAGWTTAWLGLTIGNLIGYGAGRLWPRRLTPELPEPPTLLLLLVSRSVPVLAEAVAIAAGATRTRLGAVAAACAIGNAVYAGLLTAGAAALVSIDNGGIGLVVPMLVPALAWVIWRRLQRRKRPPEMASGAR